MKRKQVKRPTTLKENAGRVSLDMGKLMFGSFILGGVLRGEVPQYILLIVGFIGSAALIGFGLAWTTRTKGGKE
jgi:hypothetical protein